MYVPDRHMSETVEDAMQEEGKKALKDPPGPCAGPMIKIVINAGPTTAPNPHPKPHNPKPKRKKDHGDVAGPMESALKNAY